MIVKIPICDMANEYEIDSTPPRMTYPCWRSVADANPRICRLWKCLGMCVHLVGRGESTLAFAKLSNPLRSRTDDLLKCLAMKVSGAKPRRRFFGEHHSYCQRPAQIRSYPNENY